MARGRTKSTLHYHGCTSCRRKYSCGVDKCQADGRCNPCISGIHSILAEGSEPQDCCFRNTPLPQMRTQAEREPYKLFGPTWFKCPTCARQFPVQPPQVRTTP